ncbi:hypothetical protein [Flavobacterium muglaense]|uniref:Uncharacterized protein n=1 Tax=Flavobacterium muglaense TaxID=2764716 RepID=A0A923N0B4_9FLAO|nr:hypothetical protein [Flavobacterium muglaense]MBC5838420.1 hypothetical protein [Flavobacterium muglaense]MBC5845026.1 hypothetical protein [Flavobacterium muglaense]
MKTEKGLTFQLVEGEFAPLEAKKILLGLINSKINFHQLEHFSNEVRFNEKTSHSKQRVKILTDASEQISALVATASNMQFMIEGSIQITLVPAEESVINE